MEEGYDQSGNEKETIIFLLRFRLLSNGWDGMNGFMLLYQLEKFVIELDL